MGGIAIHYLAKTKLGIKTYENPSELHTQTDVPSCIKSVVIQSVITAVSYTHLAVANGLPVIAVNRVGHEPDPSGQTNGIQFWGNS